MLFRRVIILRVMHALGTTLIVCSNHYRGLISAPSRQRGADGLDQ